ncbi:MAG: hypothetical protein OJF49_000841 [Ktedonobacterales bacterium]|jgi:hypothetical protein|nr:MAG: hypothetical protein OJF49_000841 [Ktedonobacterales bacterium]
MANPQLAKGRGGRGGGAIAASVGQSAPAATIPGATGAVQIERIIQHQLDNQTPQLVVSQEIATLSAEAHPLFVSYIAATASRADWCGTFAETDGEVAQACRALLDDDTSFVTASQGLAQRLFARMKPKNIAAGDFAALVYREDGDAQRHVALLKLDPQTRLARRFAPVDGRMRVVYERADNLLPEDRQLQKCALITASATSGGFDVTLLDNQAGPRAEGVAAFFYKGFLGVALAPSPRRLTRGFLDLTDLWLDAHRDRLNPEELFKFYAARRAVLSAPQVVLAPFAALALPTQPALRASLVEQLAGSLSEGLDGRVDRFDVDAAIAAPLLNYVTLELDGGARLRVRADRLTTLLDPKNIRKTGNTYELVLSSLTLKEVSGA